MENRIDAKTLDVKFSSIEILRVVSAVAVIMIHIVAGAVSEFGKDVTISVEIFNAIHVLLKWSVPVFFMISGYCILGKKSTCDYKWVLPRVGRFLGALFVFGFVFACFERYFSSKSISLSLIAGSLADIFKGDLWDHMWYVYCIIGVYLVLPVLHAFFSAKRENVLYLTALCFAFNIIIPLIERFTGWEIAFSLPFTKHLTYVCIGALIAKYPLKDDRKYDVFCAVMLVAAAVAAVVDKDATGGYYSIWVCLMATAIFMIFVRRDFKCDYVRLRKLSSLTWGVYLIHPLFINLIYKFFGFDPFSHVPVLCVVVITLIVTALSFAVIFVLKKIPFVSKIL